MLDETLEVEAFANGRLTAADPGVRADHAAPAMTTPVSAFTPAAAQYVVAGSTICLIC